MNFIAFEAKPITLKTMNFILRSATVSIESLFDRCTDWHIDDPIKLMIFRSSIVSFSHKH